MSVNIIDLVKSYITPSVVAQLASHLGESEAGVSKAVDGLLPAVVGGLANHHNSAGLLDQLRSMGNSGQLAGLASGASTQDTTVGLLTNNIFGDNTGSVVSSIASYADINESSANSLLNMVAGATFGAVGKYVVDNNLDQASLSKILSDQKDDISSRLPAGLSLAGLGFGDWFGKEPVPQADMETLDPNRVNPGSTTTGANTAGAAAAASAVGRSTTTTSASDVDVTRAGKTHVHVDKKDAGGSVWKWLLPLLLLILIGWLLMRQCNKKNVTDNTAVTTTAPADSGTTADNNAMANTDNREMTTVDLNGQQLRGYAKGMEENLIKYLRTGAYKTADDAELKNNWFAFDNVNFRFNEGTDLLPGSEEQLQNLAAILKAYPDAKIKIGGNADKVGSDQANEVISQERADFLRSELGRLGVANQVVAAEGYSDEYATVSSNASNAERATDRNMAIRFVK